MGLFHFLVFGSVQERRLNLAIRNGSEKLMARVVLSGPCDSYDDVGDYEGFGECCHNYESDEMCELADEICVDYYKKDCTGKYGSCSTWEYVCSRMCKGYDYDWCPSGLSAGEIAGIVIGIILVIGIIVGVVSCCCCLCSRKRRYRYEANSPESNQVTVVSSPQTYEYPPAPSMAPYPLPYQVVAVPYPSTGFGYAPSVGPANYGTVPNPGDRYNPYSQSAYSGVYGQDPYS
jgi:hypothetical protein